jgi:cobalt-zinc-cadmium efflux system outer membrane protein
MSRTKRPLLCAMLAIIAGSAGGCASINPEPDYRRLRAQVQRATGYAQSYQPGEEAAVTIRIRALLADGLTASEAAEVALLNNADLQAACYSIGIARADVVQSGLLSNPSLGVALRLPSGGGLAGLEADLAQNIADLWQIPARVRAAERGLDRVVLDVAARAVRVAAAAKSAYYAATGADRRLAIAQENLGITRKVLELAEYRRSAGAGSELDVNLARGVTLETDLTVQRARLAAADARRTLAEVLGLTLDADGLVLTQALVDVPENVLDAELLTETALGERLDVRALRQAVQSAEERLVLEYRRVFPTLEIGVALERGERERAEGRDLLADTARASIAAGRLTAPEMEPRSARRVNTDFSIGPSVALELPIFDQNQAQIARARHELEQSRRRLDGLQRAVRQEVRGAVDQMHTAWHIARFYRDEVVPQAQRSLELSRESYHAGKSTVLAVLDAERTYLIARDGNVEALLAAASAIPALERVVGLPFDHVLKASGSGSPARRFVEEAGDRSDAETAVGTDPDDSSTGDGS